MVHLSVQKFSENFKAIYKRNNFSTPKNYLDFIKNYMNFLAGKRKMMDGMVRRLDGGLITLARAQEDTEELSKVLEVKNKDIAEKSVVVAELIKDIGEKSEQVGKEKAAADIKKEQLDKDSIIIAREEAEASVALEEAIPALEAAKRALENINKAALDELKALAQPPTVVIDVCAAAFYLQPKSTGNPDWAAIKV